MNIDCVTSKKPTAVVQRQKPTLSINTMISINLIYYTAIDRRFTVLKNISTKLA